MEYENILREYPHTTLNALPQQVEVILKELEQVIKNQVTGEVVELGCHAGLTSVYIKRLLNELNSDRQFHAYDSFCGLPTKVDQDQAIGEKADKFQEGYFDLKGTWQIEQRFKSANLGLPILHEGWFVDQEYPENISFGFLDGDFYDSIRDSLIKVWPRLSIGGVICIHDYKWDQLPGVEKAIFDFFGSLDNVESPTFGLAVIRKK